MKKIWLSLLLLQFVIGISVFGTVLGIPATFIRKYDKNSFGNHPLDTTYRIIKAPGNTYGYEILISDKAIIRQQNIPGRPGISGFKKRTDAAKVAGLVLKKLRIGIIPPSIEEDELYKLKISY